MTSLFGTQRAFPFITISLLLAASINILLIPRLTPRATAQVSGHGPELPARVHEKFATFLAGPGFKATLLLENLRPDVAITVQSSLILKSGEVPLKMLSLPAHSTHVIDISAFLRAHGYPDSRGTVCVRFSFSSYGPLTAVAESEDEADHVYLNSYAQSAEEYWSGTAYDAVVWAPSEGTKGFVSIINTSFEPKTVHVSFLVDGQAEQLHGIEIGPRQTYFLPIDDLIARSRKSGAGIHIEYDEYPGDVVVEGQIFNQQTGFAKYIHFADVSLNYPSATLRTHFALLGEQPAEEGYPAGVSFHSVAAVRNIDTVSLSVTPTVRFFQDGAVRTIPLNPLPLAPGESRIVDLSQAQGKGLLPADVHQASLELVPPNNSGKIVAELFNFDNGTGGYVVGPSFTSYPNRDTASIWRTDGTFQTEIMVENTAADDDTVSLKVFSGDGPSYLKKFPITAGGLLKINVKELQQQGVADDNGHLLQGTSGILYVAGSRNTKSKLSFDKIIHSADEANYVGLPPNPCDYVQEVFIFMDFSGGQNPYPVMNGYMWSISGEQDEAGGFTVSSNTSIAQVSQNASGDTVTFTWPQGSQSPVTLSYGPVNVETEDCDACTGGPVPVQSDTVTPPPSVSFSNISGVSVGQTANTTATVTPSNNTTPISLSISGGAAIVSPTGTFTTTTNVVVKGLSAGTATLTATVTNPDGGTGTETVGSTSFPVQVPVPTSLVRAASPCAPTGGIGPLTIVNDGNVVDCSGNVTQNQCGVYRNYTFMVVDQNRSEFLTPYTITESFSNFTSTIPGDTQPAPRTSSNSDPTNFFASDIQYVGFTTSPTFPMCLASNDNDSFTQNFTVTVNGQAYPLTTTISIQRGRFSGTYEVNSTITKP